MKNGFLSINDVFLIITVSLTFLMAILLRLLPERDSAFRDNASLFFMAWGVSLISMLFIWNPFLQVSPLGHSVLAPLVLTTSTLLQGVFFAALIHWVEKGERFSVKHWMVQVIPAAFVALLVLAYGMSVQDWMPSNWKQLDSAKAMAVQLAWAISSSIPLVYGVWALVFLALRWKSSESEPHSYGDERLYSPRYTFLFALAYSFMGLWACMAFWLGFGLDLRINVVLGEWGIYLQSALAAVMLLMGYRSMRQWMKMDISESAQLKDVKNEKTAVDERVMIIEQAINIQKVYLDAHLNLERFSEKIGMKPRDVSALLNSHYKMNFFEFINRHRVEEAKRLLIECQNSTVIDVIYKSGFNSQSAFHRFFKRFAGATPSEYRQIHQPPSQTSSGMMLKAG